MKRQEEMVKTVVLNVLLDECETILCNDVGEILEEIVGEVPTNPAWGGGNNILLEIDNATGTIIGWKPITRLPDHPFGAVSLEERS